MPVGVAVTGAASRSPVDEAGDRLYSLPPEQFVPARDEAVATARGAGDRATAAAVGAFRKPTLAAWLVNLLALRRPELLAELFEVGEALRAAQHELRGEQLRELSTQRRSVVEALSEQARRLARAAGGARHADLPVAEVAATLNAALADAEVARQVREGRLVRAASYTGFGETPQADLRVAGGGAPARTAGKPGAAGRQGGAGKPGRAVRAGGPWAEPGGGAGPQPGASRAAEPQPGAGGAGRAGVRPADAGRAEGRGAAGRAAKPGRAEPGPAKAARPSRAEADLAAARTRSAQAQAALEQATTAERDAGAARDELVAALAELRARHSAAQTALTEAQVRRRRAQRDAQAATRELNAAQQRVDRQPRASGDQCAGERRSADERQG